jgi:hypothetical protein
MALFLIFKLYRAGAGGAENGRSVNGAFMRPMLSPRQLAKFTRRH